MDKLRSIEAFICAVESGNFSEAARRLDITAVMVGKHVRQLEQALDARLLQRNTRRQSLTEAGERYYRQCKAALLQLRQAEESVEQMKGTPSGLLRISAPLNLGASAVAGVVAAYQRRYPQVKIELDLSDEFVDLVGEGFDFALRVGRLNAGDGLVAQHLGDYQMVVCATPDYLAQHGTPQTPQDLYQHRCLCNMAWNKSNAWQFAGIPWPTDGSFVCNDGQALRQAALAGAGLILQPRILLAEDIAAGRLVELLQPWRQSSRPIHLLWRQDLSPSEKRRSFISWMREQLPAALAV
ncbi:MULTISPECIES: LysR family transcriptional regulator [unclassified Erwinia]|uniref:LysR family transcriptional regulator n=1 Tax=unclassified Erwinia TaxID=2622719 RepID=UPI0006FD789E|nr:MULTISPECIES: LysR family transcriptional regulator [unclassified Erwinia]KQN53789.1 LysR family transcriptional regulator [Erwinia sp. Leaf53]PLV62272.1 LysR family transcriptional regulator [Erwinia sp. B116]